MPALPHDADRVVSDPVRIDAAWVQRVLQAADVVGRDAVAAIQMAATQASTWSRLNRIGVHYRPGTACMPTVGASSAWP